MHIQELSGGWNLYGKTGSGKLHGWFVGYIEKNGRTIEFVSHIVDTKKQNTVASFRARNEALNKLWYVIDDLERWGF
jgi:beta-lactamase class D OXA-29